MMRLWGMRDGGEIVGGGIGSVGVQRVLAQSCLLMSCWRGCLGGLSKVGGKKNRQAGDGLYTLDLNCAHGASHLPDLTFSKTYYARIERYRHSVFAWFCRATPNEPDLSTRPILKSW